MLLVKLDGFPQCLAIALASPEFITKVIIVTKIFVNSASVLTDSNSSKDFSNTFSSFELFLFSKLLGLGSDI
jgi:hypothetical protein